MNYLVERTPILKNNQNPYHPRFGFAPKTGIAFPKTGVLFLPCIKPQNLCPLVLQQALHSEKILYKVINENRISKVFVLCYVPGEKAWELELR